MTESEKTTILLLSEQGETITAISARLGRCRGTVRRVITKGTVRGGLKRRGPKRKIMFRTLRLLLRMAKTGKFTSRQLRDRYAPHVTIRRVQQLLQNDPDLNWRRAPAAPKLTPTHRQARLKWARQMLAQGQRYWKKSFSATRAGSRWMDQMVSRPIGAIPVDLLVGKSIAGTRGEV